MKWAALLSRAVLGLVWLVAGVLKLGDPAASVRAVRAYDLLPESLATVVGHGLPVLEALLGLCLLAGLFVRAAAGVSAALLVAFIVGIATAWARGLSIECGCFGGGGPDADPSYALEIARDAGLLALAAYLLWRPSTDWVVRTKQTFLVAAGLAAALFIGFAVQTSADTSGASATAPAGADGYAVVVGSADAPHEVTVYEDFMCPYCGLFEAATRSVLDDALASGRVRVSYHVMSFLDHASSSAYSSRAANAFAVVLDTAGPDPAKRFHDLLFEHQPKEGSAGLSDEQLVDYAVQAGADRSRVEGPIRDRRFEQWVVNVNDAASKDGISSTPTVLLDGRPLAGQTFDQQAASLAAALG